MSRLTFFLMFTHGLVNAIKVSDNWRYLKSITVTHHKDIKPTNARPVLISVFNKLPIERHKSPPIWIFLGKAIINYEIINPFFLIGEFYSNRSGLFLTDTFHLFISCT